jgi:hypothetical protein
MVRNSCLSHREAAAQPLAADFALSSNVLQDLEAALVGQCLGDPLKLIGVH